MRTKLTRLPLESLPALLLFAALLSAPLPWLKTAGGAARTDFSVPVLFSAALLYAALRLPGRWRSALSLSVTLAAYALALVGLWANGLSETAVVSGLLPWNDAASYYQDALRLLQGSPVTSFSARRPLFAGTLALLLTVTGGHLQASLAVLTMLMALSAHAFTREIQRTHGPAAAAAAWAVLFLFARRFTGIALTESVGFSLGVLGLALLWRGAAHQRLWHAAVGLLTLTLALNARAGTFFVLPLLLLWLGWAFRGACRFAWRPVLWGGLAVALGFALNFAVLRVVASPTSAAFSNFSFSLYGVSVGGKGWTQVFRDHPEVANLPEPQRSQTVYALALDEIRRQPLNFARGALRQWQLFFTDPWFGVYSYVGGENPRLQAAAWLGLYVLWGLALVRALRRPPQPIPWLVLAVWVGVLLSVPFVPPEDAHKMRPYAATIAVFAWLPALGTAELLRWLRLEAWENRALGETPQMNRLPGAVLALAGLVVLAGPLSLLLGHAPAPLPELTCPTPQESAVVRYQPGTFIQLIPKSDLRPDVLPTFHTDVFRRQVHNLPNSEAALHFERLKAPAWVWLDVDRRTLKRVWVVLDEPPPAPEQAAWLGVCGSLIEAPASAEKPFLFRVQRVLWAQPR